MSTSITWNKKEITNPILRVLVTIWAITLAAVVIGTIIVTFPIWIPLHFILKALGRRGFWTVDSVDKSIQVHLTVDGFRRA